MVNFALKMRVLRRCVWALGGEACVGELTPQSWIRDSSRTRVHEAVLL